MSSPTVHAVSTGLPGAAVITDDISPACSGGGNGGGVRVARGGHVVTHVPVPQLGGSWHQGTVSKSIGGVRDILPAANILQQR